MATKKAGKIYFNDKELTDAEVDANYIYPCMFFVGETIVNEAGQPYDILKHIVYNRNGIKSVRTYTGGGPSSDTLEDVRGRNNTIGGDINVSAATTYFSLYQSNSLFQSEYSFDGGIAYVETYDVTNNSYSSLRLNGNSVVIDSNAGLSPGLIGNKDFSSGYLDYSYIQKDYFLKNRNKYVISTADSTPNKTWTNGVRLTHTNNLGVNKDLAYLEDITDDSRKLLKRYVHTVNREITHTAVDYATGYVTAAAHGFTHSGQKLVGLFVNGLVKQLPSYAPTDRETLPDSFTIPFEWLQADIYVKVIDTNTVMICNASGAIITVNPTSAQNSGRIDSTKWHIEDFGECDFSDIPQGSQRIEIVVKGFTMGRGFSSATRLIQPLIHSTDNSIRWIDGGSDVVIPNNFIIDVGTSKPYVGLLINGTTNKQCISTYIQIKLELKDTIGLKQATESLSYWGGALRNVNTTIMTPSLASVGKNKGIAGLRITSSAMVKEPVFFANNTVIEVYKL